MERLPTILVVDDEANAREVMDGILRDQGYSVAFAKSGAEALAQARALAPDLVLLDVMMPEMDGFETCRRFRSDPALAYVPVVMVTALDDRESKLRGIEAGADDFVSKPVDRIELKARVRTITRLDRFRALHSEREKFEWAVENSEDGYLVLDADDEILYANPKARHFLGLANDGGGRVAAGKFLSVARREYRLSPGGVRVRRTRGDGLGQRSIGFLVKPESDSHEATWLRVDRLKMGPESSAKALVRLSDSTDRVLRQRDAWAFNTIVRHKLNTPLTSLIGAIDCMGDCPAVKTDRDLASFLEVASHGAKRLAADIAGIFDYLATVTGKGPRGERSSSREVPEAALRAADLVGLDRRRLAVPEAAEHGDLRLSLSVEELEIVFAALLENSKKFHPENAPTVTIGLEWEGGAFRVRVEDDGVHLSPEQLEHVWLPYYQAERYFTGQVPGMGLGLATVAAVVARSGGACEIRNRTGAPGIVVEFTSPLAEGRGLGTGSALA